MELNSSHGSVFELEYVEYIIDLSGDIHTQQALDHLISEVSRYHLCFAPSKCKVFLKNRHEPVVTNSKQAITLYTPGAQSKLTMLGIKSNHERREVE